MGLSKTRTRLTTAEERFLQALLWEEAHLQNGPATRAISDPGLSYLRLLEAANRLSPNFSGEALARIEAGPCPPVTWPWPGLNGTDVLRRLWGRWSGDTESQSPERTHQCGVPEALAPTHIGDASQVILTWTNYDGLRLKLISLLLGDLLPLPRWDDDKRYEQQIAIAVHEATGLSPEHWARLDHSAREPWLEKTIAMRTKDQPEDNTIADPFAAIQEIVRDLIQSKARNVGAGTHLPGTGPVDERIMRRAARHQQGDEVIIELRRLAALALPLGVKAGFSGETVETRLGALLRAAEAFTRWETGLRPASDDEAEYDQWLRLVGELEAALGSVMNLAAAGFFAQATEGPGNEKLPPTKPVQSRVFFSYSHKDKKWLTEFQTMLKPAVQADLLWDDSKVKASDKWREEIKQAIASATAAVLLVSPAFLASDFIATNELPPLLEAAKKNGLRVLWVHVSHSMVKHTAIEQYQATHDAGQPLDAIRPKAKRDQVIVRICEQIKAAAEKPR